MFRLMWAFLKYFIIIPLLVVALYLGVLLPATRVVSLWKAPEPIQAGLDAFAQFGDYCARQFPVYGAYYNQWLPDDAKIGPQPSLPEAVPTEPTPAPQAY